jgi:hypothetical protein
MSVAYREAPEAAKAALRGAITMFMDPVTPATLEEPQDAVPVFVFDSKAPLTVSELLGLEQPTAWRFVLKEHGVPVATGDVTRTSNSYELSSVSDDSTQTRAFLKAISDAALATEDRGNFELRLFEAPAFHVYAVWLHPSQPLPDYFALLHARQPQVREKLVTADDLIQIVSQAQATKLGPRGMVNYSREPPA